MERRMDRRDRERSRGHLASTSTGSNTGNSGDQQRADFDSRTPLAWQHRDFNYQQHSTFNERYPEGVPSSNSDRFSHPSLGSRSARSGTHERQSAGGRPHKQQQHSSQANHDMNQRTAGSQGGHHNGGYRSSDRTQPSSEETTTGSSSETESDSNPDRGHQSRPGTSGTLRSMQSMPLMSPLHTPFNPAVLGGIYGVGMVPMLPSNTWNGEPCPVHGASLPHTHVPISMTPYPTYHPPMYSSVQMRRAASVHELAMATPLPALMPPPPTTMSIYGTLPGPSSQFLHAAALSGPTPTPDHPSIFMMGPPSLLPPPPPKGPPPHRMRMPPHRGSAASSLPPMPPPSLLPPLQRGSRPLVVNEKNGHPEPLPVREAPPLPLKMPPSSDPGARSKTPSKSSTKAISYDACCRGNVVVLWVILGIIGLGIVMGVVFYFAFQ